MKNFKLLLLLSAVFIFGAFSCPDKHTLSVTPSSLSFEARETQKKPLVITTDAETWDYQVMENWITAEKQENVLYISVQNYTNTSQSRTAVITITAGKAPAVPVTITQNAKTIDKLSVSPTSLTFGANETATKTVAVTTDAPSWTVTAGASWITATKSGDNVNVRVSQNTSRSERSSIVTVKGGDASDAIFSVSQEPAIPFLDVTPSSYNFSSSAGSTSISVTSNVSWSASSNATSWLTVSASGSNNGSFTINVTANSSTSSRSGVITVSGEGKTATVSVTQDGRIPTYPPQVRFRKTSNNISIYEMSIDTNTNPTRELASYYFGTSTGTSSYYNITAGNHLTLVYRGGSWYSVAWNNGSDTYNFQNNHRYTFEYDGTYFWMRDEGTYNISNEGFNAPQQPIITVPAQQGVRVIEVVNRLQDLSK